MRIRESGDIVLSGPSRSGFLSQSFFVTTFLLLTSSIIILAMSVPYFYIKYIGPFDSRSIAGLAYYITTGIGVYLLIPALLCKFIFKVKLADLGLRMPVLTLINIFITLMALTLMLPFIYYFSQHPYLRKFYSLSNLGLPSFLFVMILLQPIYYYAEEFFFRGFLFITLWQRIGWHSFWVTDFMFVCAHANKPIPELLLCIPASVVLNYLVLRTGSIYPAFITHWLLGMILNMIVYFN